MELIGWSVVVTANQFNPSIFNQQWLIQHQVVLDDEIRPSIIIAEGLSQFETRDFNLLVVPQMLQFATKPNVQNEGRIIAERIARIANTLPQTPYTAIGLNFTWFTGFGDETVSGLTRRLFCREGVPYNMFDQADARFGAYLSRDFNGMRLKLDIKPGIVTVNQQQEDRLVFAFNFHRSIQPGEAEAARIIGDVVGQWENAKEESRRIVLGTVPEGH